MHKSIAAMLVFAALTARADEAPKAAKPPSTEEQLMVNPDSVKWKPAPTPGLPPGAEVAPVAVDPQSGGSVAYARLPGGYHLPMHWHSHAEYSLVVSGKATLTVDGKAHPVSAGSYAVIPAKVHHQLVCDQGSPCVLFTRRAGPADYNFVK